LFPDLELTRAEVRAILSRADQIIETSAEAPSFLGGMADARYSISDADISGVARSGTEQARQERGEKITFDPANSEIRFLAADTRTVSPGSYPESLRQVVKHTSLGYLEKQEGYKAAKKGGDANAAARVVNKVVKPSVVQSIRDGLDPERSVVFAPVIHREGENLNMLPLAYAKALARAFDAEVWTGVVKVSGDANSHAPQSERATNTQIFQGETPDSGVQVVVVDDTITSGDTFASIIDTFSNDNVMPVMATSLAAGRYQNWLSPTTEKIQKMLDKAGMSEGEFEHAFGYKPTHLTGSEIQGYILNGKAGPDGIRNRFPARRSAAGVGNHGQVLRPESNALAHTSEEVIPSFARKPKSATSIAETVSEWKQVKAGDTVSGLTVRKDVPNASSINASLDDWVDHGIREVPMDLFTWDPGEQVLADKIRESGEISPLIVVVDGHPDGIAYILEGAHRLDALQTLGVKSLPALVVEDADTQDSPSFARKPGKPSGKSTSGQNQSMSDAAKALQSNVAAAKALNDGRRVNTVGMHVPHAAPPTQFSATTGEFPIEEARIDTTTKSLLKLIGMIESAPDKLRRGKGLGQLAGMVEGYFDTHEKRLGQINGTLRPVFQSLEDKKAAMKSFERYFRAKENGRDNAARKVLDAASPGARQLIETWGKLADETGRINQIIKTPYGVGLKVWDAKTRGYRTIGRIGKGFFPRTLRQDVQAVLQNPSLDPELWNTLVDSLLAEGRIKTREQARKYLTQYFTDEVRSDYFAGIEKARGEALPEAFYEYSWDAAARYLQKWAQRISQVEHFGQAFDKAGDWFDINLPKIQDRATQNYVGQIRDRVYNAKPLDGFSNLMSWLNLAATGLQLGNPATAFLNLIGGTTMNVQMYGWKNVLKAYKEVIQDWERVQQTGTTLGILGKDVLNILKDAERDAGRYFENASKVTDALSTFADFTMTYGGYKGTENIIRATGMMAAKNWLHEGLRAVNANPKSGRAKKFYRWMQTENLDAEAIIKENGHGPNTAKFLRRAVNIPQGSYRVDMTPVYVDTPMGRFLFKYQKFGTQLSRMFWRHHLKPFMESVGGGTEVKVAATGETVRSRQFMDMFRFFAAAIGGGTLIAMGRAGVFGYQDPGPELEDVEKALQNKDTGRAWGLIFSRAWNSMNAAGALGFYGNYLQFGLDWRDQQRAKNPFSPPGLASLDAIIELASRAREQGRLNAKDLDEIAEQTVSLYRGYKRMSLSGLDVIGADFDAVQTYAAQQEKSYARKQARRYADEMEIENRQSAPGGRFAKTPMSPANRDINNALLAGDVERARIVMREQLERAETGEERDKMLASMKASVRARQPVRIAGAPSNSERLRFLRWAKQNLPAEGYERIRRIDKRYRMGAERLDLM
jgi:hypothetical protein